MTFGRWWLDLDCHLLAAMAGLILLGALVALGVCVARGWSADTRDPSYGIGRILLRHAETDDN